MTITENGKIELSKEAADMLESMPREVAISVMISLAANMIRMKHGELKGDTIPDDPVMLVAEMAAMIAIRAVVAKIVTEDPPSEAIDKTKVH